MTNKKIIPTMKDGETLNAYIKRSLKVTYQGVDIPYDVELVSPSEIPKFVRITLAVGTP